MLTDIRFETINTKKSVITNYGTWKQVHDTVYITSTTGIGKNNIRKYCLSADKQQLTTIIDPPQTDVLGDTIKGKQYTYHPGAECPFDVRKKTPLNVYGEGHL